MASACALMFSSLTPRRNASQLFHPIGGVRARRGLEGGSLPAARTNTVVPQRKRTATAAIDRREPLLAKRIRFSEYRRPPGRSKRQSLRPKAPDGIAKDALATQPQSSM